MALNVIYSPSSEMFNFMPDWKWAFLGDCPWDSIREPVLSSLVPRGFSVLAFHMRLHCAWARHFAAFVLALHGQVTMFSFCICEPSTTLADGKGVFERDKPRFLCFD